MQNEHKKALHVEKNKISAAERKLSILHMQHENSLQIKALLTKHNAQKRELLRIQKENKEKRKVAWNVIAGTSGPSTPSNKTPDNEGSKGSSVHGGAERATNRALGAAHSGAAAELQDDDEEGLARAEQNREAEIKQVQETYQRAKDKLVELKKKQQAEFLETVDRHKAEETEMEDNFEDEGTRMLMEQEEEKSLKKTAMQRFMKHWKFKKENWPWKSTFEVLRPRL